MHRTIQHLLLSEQLCRVPVGTPFPRRVDPSAQLYEEYPVVQLSQIQRRENGCGNQTDLSGIHK